MQGLTQEQIQQNPALDRRERPCERIVTVVKPSRKHQGTYPIELGTFGAARMKVEMVEHVQYVSLLNADMNRPALQSFSRVGVGRRRASVWRKAVRIAVDMLQQWVGAVDRPIGNQPELGGVTRHHLAAPS